MKKWVVTIVALCMIAMTYAQRHILINTAGDVVDARHTPVAQPAITYDSDVIDVYFSPDDNVRDKLITAIENERCSIKIAIFTLTDPKIAKALKRAFRRGISIEILTDPTCLKDRFNKINYLSQKGVPVYVYNVAHDNQIKYSCMHHKFAVFGCDHQDKRYVWTGSFNFTKSANDTNQENVVVLHKRAVVDRFEQQFQKIKNRSSVLTNSH